MAFVSFVLNNQFYVGGVAIHSRPQGGFRLVYPTKTLANAKVIQLFHPICREASEAVEQTVIGKFEALIADARRDEDVSATTRQRGGEHDVRNSTPVSS